MTKYNPKKIERKWQKRWKEEKIYQVDLDKAKNPYYNLMMFPYPSAEGLHIGNMYAFVHSDAYGRFMRLKGYDVFEPIGLDGFGIHSENYAIKIGEHIKDVSRRTEKNFYKQLRMIGNAYDWSRTVETYKPNYYKWTQWLFLKMYEKGLAYRRKSSVNWCPSCKTVLSNEQVISGKCERCNTQTEKKDMEQWFWRITDYAEKLLKNLDWIDWSEDVKTIQKNWIGKSEGALVKFKIIDSDYFLEVFTTRPDTLFGCTYMVVCPEHEMLEKFQSNISNWVEVEKYIKQAKRKSDLDRTDLNKDKTGVKIKGLMAINPVNGKKIPLFVADYVLADYGTGAIMAVPAHDERDLEFAKKFNLPVIKVLETEEECFTGEGITVNSEFLNGLKTKDAIKEITRWLSKKKLGKKAVSYKLRDWCISRQRYWGPPIPMIKCEKCGWVSVPEKDLPVMLPEMDDFLPDGSGKGPLNKVEKFVNTVCPKCGGPGQRETDVSDPFVDSSWYYMRYLCAEFNDRALDKKRLKKWMPIDMYIGGKEHSVLHLLYSRFVTMVMHELGYSPEEEPFKQFRAHGLLISEGAKISKSKGNVVNPDEYINKFGADAVRMYLMFLGDMRQGGDWRDSGMKGMHKFVARVYNLFNKVTNKRQKSDKQVKRLLHKTIKGIEEDLAKLKYNTAIAKLMILVNKIQESGCSKDVFGKFVIMLSPFAPHLAEELWEMLGYKKSILKQKWPAYDEKLIQEETWQLIIQINGKVRDKIEVKKDISEEEVRELALSQKKVKKWLDNKQPKKIIYIPNRLVNLVV
jgi:leucyl-tRNA synthetase